MGILARLRLEGRGTELYMATNRVAKELGIELVELDQATCTGAGVIQEQNPEMADALNARTFALAQQLGLPLMNICSTCQGIESMVQDKLTKRPEYLDEGERDPRRRGAELHARAGDQELPLDPRRGLRARPL